MVWSVDGPVLVDEVGPAFRTQLKLSDLSCRYPHKFEGSKSQPANIGAALCPGWDVAGNTVAGRQNGVSISILILIWDRHW